MSNRAKISEADYCLREETARIMGLTPEQLDERLRWGRGPHPVGRDREGRQIWVRAMVKSVQDARAAGHVI